MAPGDEVRSGADAPIKPGNAMALRHVPVGSIVHNIEMKPGKGGQLARSAGSSASFTSREGIYAFLRVKSGEIRKVHVDCRATIGEMSNDEHNLRSYGKAGAKRWRGIRPTVRGVAMNPVDHPHGGGEGKSGQGNPHPVSPVGLEHQGPEDAPQQAHRAHDRPAPSQQDSLTGPLNAAFNQKRPVRRSAPGEEGADRLAQERSQADQDLVAPLDGDRRRWSASRSPCTTAVSTSRC